MITNYLIRLEFKLHNAVARLHSFWNFLKAHNSFWSLYSLLDQVTFFEIGVYTDF